nr:hypothetical protein [Tanacetum cinerariifolium]
MLFTSAKTITTLNEEIKNLDSQLSKENSIVSYLQQEREKLKSDFKTCEDELLDKLIQYEKKIKELDHILVKIEADESLDKITVLEYENERLLKAVVSQNIMSIMQKNFIEDTSDLKTELERMKQKFETCIIKKENEYDVLWNNWYRKYEECKYDNILYDKAYNDTQHQIERLQAQLEDLKGKIVSQNIMSIMQKNFIEDTSDLKTELERMKQKFETCIIKKENEYDVLWNNWYRKYEECKYDNILYDKAYNDTQHQIERLQAQLEDRKGKREKSTAKTRRPRLSSNLKNDRTPSASKSNCLSNNLEKVEEHHRNLLFSKTPNHSKKDVNSNINGLSSTGEKSTAKTRRPRPSSNLKNDRTPSASKSNCLSNNLEKVEEHHRNLLFSKTPNH